MCLRFFHASYDGKCIRPNTHIKSNCEVNERERKRVGVWDDISLINGMRQTPISCIISWARVARSVRIPTPTPPARVKRDFLSAIDMAYKHIIYTRGLFMQIEFNIQSDTDNAMRPTYTYVYEAMTRRSTHCRGEFIIKRNWGSGEGNGHTFIETCVQSAVGQRRILSSKQYIQKRHMPDGKCTTLDACWLVLLSNLIATRHAMRWMCYQILHISHK